MFHSMDHHVHRLRDPAVLFIGLSTASTPSPRRRRLLLSGVANKRAQAAILYANAAFGR